MSMPGDAEKLDRAIEETITFQSAKFIDQIITREHCRQMDLAAILGVTPEHLSAIKNGARIPSFQTFNFLKTLALDENAFRVADPTNFPKVASG
jgi:transcriptional regulator with XRE-family HTH domain